MAVEIKHCTSCGSDQIVVAGNKFLCRVCNIVYEVTDTGTKVLDTNPLDRHEQRLDQVVRDIAELKKEQDGDESIECPDPDEAKEFFDKTRSNKAEDVDETEVDGFISW